MGDNSGNKITQMRGFEEGHQSFLRDHLQRRTGERKDRLKRGHAHGEKLFARNIWWPVKGNFDDLHPEYEVPDWRGRPYFADYAYAPKSLKLLLEIKGFGEHVTNMDRTKYSNELNRETFLTALGFRVVSFSYDDVKYRPEICIHLLQIVLGRLESSLNKVERVHFADQEVLRLAVSLVRPIRPVDVSQHFSIDHRTAVRHLRRLSEKGWLRPIKRGRGIRIMGYELTKDGLDSGLWGN